MPEMILQSISPRTAHDDPDEENSHPLTPGTKRNTGCPDPLPPTGLENLGATNRLQASVHQPIPVLGVPSILLICCRRVAYRLVCLAISRSPRFPNFGHYRA